jgi:TonB family protein
MTIMARLGLLLMWLLTIVGSHSVSGQTALQSEPALFDEDVKLVRFVDVKYSPPIARARLQGVVVVRAVLDREGRVAAATAISGPKALIPSALDNARQWRFEPNERASAVIVYDFRIDNGPCHDAGVKSLSLLRHPNFVSVRVCQMLVGG